MTQLLSHLVPVLIILGALTLLFFRHEAVRLVLWVIGRWFKQDTT